MSQITKKISLPWLKKSTVVFATLALGIFLSTSLSNIPASALKIGIGKTVFEKSPRLIEAGASQTAPGASSSYQFTIEVPEEAGEPLQAVKITQKPNLEEINFKRELTRAHLGELFAAEAPSLSVVSIGGKAPSEENEVLVVFDPPVDPGNKVTISLKANNNPLFGGVYLFGITAFSVGENSEGLYLGSARLHFPLR